MKFKREIKVAILAIVCGFLLYFGLYFLRGVNIFSSTNQYVGHFTNLGGLTEQAPVMIRGYKVGQVDAISYDFAKENSFTIQCSLDKHIILPEGTKMVLMDDGLLGGKAIDIRIPLTSDASAKVYQNGDELPTVVEKGLMATLQENVMVKVDSLLSQVNSVIHEVNDQLEGNHIKQSLSNIESITTDLKTSARDIHFLTHDQMPDMMANADTAIMGLKQITQNLENADLQATINRVDTAIDNLNETVENVNSLITSKEGTLGLLINDKNLYNHIDSAIVSVDSLVTDLKSNPKRYLHLSLFEKKEKKK